MFSVQMAELFTLFRWLICSPLYNICVRWLSCSLFQVAELFSCGSSNPAKAVLRGKSSMSENLVIYPPNGIIPFHGLAMFCAPFCYVYTDPLQFYFTFRAMYLRY
jgi:hypothetical protein